MELPGKAVLVYDGRCAVCEASTEWIRARMDPGSFEFLSCHSEDLPKRFPGLDKAACLKAMHLVMPDGEVLAGERAIPEILRRLRGYRRLGPLFRLPGALPVAGAIYRRFAKRRHKAAALLFHRGPKQGKK